MTTQFADLVRNAMNGSTSPAAPFRPILRRTVALCSCVCAALIVCFVLIFLASDTVSALGGKTGNETPGQSTQPSFSAKCGLGPVDIAVTADGKALLILEKDARQLRQVSLDGKSGPRVLPLPWEPERMNIFDDGRRLAIVGGGPRGELLIVDPLAWTITQRIRVGHTPSDVAPVLVDGKEIAYVANRFDGTVSIVDLKSGREIDTWNAGREPISLRAIPDGSKLVVAGHLPEDSSLNHGLNVRVRIFRTADGSVREIPNWTGTMNFRDLCLSPGGRYAFVTGLTGHFEQIPTSIEGGWMNENALFVVDVAEERWADLFYLDDYAYGGANPWGVTVSDCGRFLVVSHAGSCDVTLMNLPRMLENLARRRQTSEDALSEPVSPPASAASASAQSPIPPHDPVMSDLQLRLRVPLGLKGMRRAVMHDDSVYAVAYFEDSIGRVDLHIEPPVRPVEFHMSYKTLYEIPERRDMEEPTPENTALRFVPMDPPYLQVMRGVRMDRSTARLGPAPVWTPERRGEMLFHDALVCLEHWQSCSSCHPDARSDCLNWDLTNDGMGNPKNTKSLLLAHETPPNMAHGVRADAETAVRAGFHHILFMDLPEEDYCAVDAYLKSLRPVESPYLVDGELSEAARRGKLFFHDARTGCAVCHPEPYFTDMKLHDVRSASLIDTAFTFDTPTLIEVWRTAPYLHDGRYTTIREVIVEGGHFDTDGRLKKLSDREIDDLVEYVLSL